MKIRPMWPHVYNMLPTFLTLPLLAWFLKVSARHIIFYFFKLKFSSSDSDLGSSLSSYKLLKSFLHGMAVSTNTSLALLTLSGHWAPLSCSRVFCSFPRALSSQLHPFIVLLCFLDHRPCCSYIFVSCFF
jgi:hypothetical protein